MHRSMLYRLAVAFALVGQLGFAGAQGFVTPEVSTLAGTTGSSGSSDGTGTAASFNTPVGTTLTPDGAALYVADRLNHLVRKIVTSTAVVTTIALGFNGPQGVAVTSDGSALYVGDTANHRVAKVCLSPCDYACTAPSLSHSPFSDT